MSAFHRPAPTRMYNCRGCGTDWPDATKAREERCPVCGIKWN